MELIVPRTLIKRTGTHRAYGGALQPNVILWLRDDYRTNTGAWQAFLAECSEFR